MTKRHRPWIKRLTCPGCLAKGTLKTILIGMPEEDFNYDLYISAGCVISSDQVDIGCSQCGWEGFRNDLDHFYGDFISITRGMRSS